MLHNCAARLIRCSFACLFVMNMVISSHADDRFTVRETDVQVSIETSRYKVNIIRAGFRFSFQPKDGHPGILPHESRGLSFLDNPAASTDVVEKSEERITFNVTNAGGATAKVTLTPLERSVRFVITPQSSGSIIMEVNGGLGPVYGMGDHGGAHPNANLDGVELRNMKHDGHLHRFFSTFAVFPQKRFAGVMFWPQTVHVGFTQSAYYMEALNSPSVSIYYFMGEPAEIYASYKLAREEMGYPGVSPKFRFFETGWETWDALQWNTNHETVTQYLQGFIDRGYPIKWAVTGSGFWNEQHTTTSFGLFHPTKYPDPRATRQWMHERDIHWLLGLRTNFVKSTTDDYVKGPFTDTAIHDGFLLMNDDGKPFVESSTVFPKTPCYLLDGRNRDAAEWFERQYRLWAVDGVKEDTMMHNIPQFDIFNRPMVDLAENGAMVMARCGAFTMPGTLHRINDTFGVQSLTTRTPVNYLQYAASAQPNVYSDTVGFGTVNSNRNGTIRHAWLMALTAGMAFSVAPDDQWTNEQLAAFEKAMRFHHRLAPYLYSAALDSHRSGYPHTMTPLPIAFPDDENTYNLANYSDKQYEWMVGPSLLAAPYLRTTDGRDRMSIYLPAGTWIEYETGKVHHGPTTLESFQMPLDRIPCFVGGKGVLVLRDFDHDSVYRAVIYPVTSSRSTYTFNWPEGHAVTRITNMGGQWNPENLKVHDMKTGKSITFQTDNRTGALSFIVEPGHDYQVLKNDP